MTIVDIHTHVFWYPDHLSDEVVDDALAAKRVKAARSGGKAFLEREDRHANDARPDDHHLATSAADKVVVFGIRARAVGIDVPNEVIADYVKRDPDRLEGWASVDPNDADCLDQLDHCVTDLGLKGLKVAPVYQHWDPHDERRWTLLRRCAELGLPVMIHQGTTYPTRARLEWGKPLQLERLVTELPDLRMIIAHLGHPWEEDVVALVRKTPNLYSDVSALHFRPWRFWQAMVTAYEYGVTHKLLFGSDFPNASTADAIAGLRGVNGVVDGTPLPRIPDDVIDQILHENWKRFDGTS
ncbi:MAG: amidohydrolase family protein [Nocardioidaceae bacterium]